jgi:hypothetical protein
MLLRMKGRGRSSMQCGEEEREEGREEGRGEGEEG